MRRPRGPSGIGWRIAGAALASALVAIVILALGVVAIGGDAFMRLMAEHGSSTAAAQAMFDSSVTVVVAMAGAAALAAALVLAVALGRRLARPLREMGAAARRIAAGDYAARVPREGPEEVASLADSFNQMARGLQEQERLRREFIANAAHELRTPLTNLQGYLEALRDGVMVADRATYESLWDEAERLVRLARGLDVLAERDAAQPLHLLELDLVPAVRSAVELAKPALERAGVRTELALPEGLPVRADPDALAQVLGNLLQNAARYTPSGGLLRIEARGRDGEVTVAVADSGPPIPAEDLPHLFERFYRVDKARTRDQGGAGIGLAIVQQLVAAQGGRVGVEATAQGNRFWFSLPAP